MWRDGQTLQLSSDRDFLVSEIARFEPNAGRAVDRFFADAREKYRIAFEKLACRNEDNPAKWLRALSIQEALRTGIWRSVWSELSRFFKSRHVREALGSYSMYLGGSPFQLPGLFSILPYGEMEYGLWLPRGGMYSIVEAMEKLALELGVKIYLNSPVSQIEKDCIRLQRNESYAADVIVSNVDVPSTRTALLGEPAPQLKMTPGVVTFYWGLKRMPEGLRHHTIFLPDDYRGSFDQLMNRGSIPADIPFYVSVPSATDQSLAPPGGSCMFVLMPVPVLSQLGSLNWEQTVASIRAKVLERLKQQGVTIPESEIVFESCWTPEDWRDRFGLFDGSAFGAAHTLHQVGAFRPSNWSREHPGLYYVGSSTTPGAGVPMVVLGGKMTAERIAAHVR
jgi:phytoene desaturase